MWGCRDGAASIIPLASALVARRVTSSAGWSLAVGVLAWSVWSACSPAWSPAPDGERVAGPALDTPEAAVAEVPVEGAVLDRPEPGEPAALSAAEGELALADLDRMRPGDIIFHTSRSAQSKAIQLATNSPYSHIGLVESGPEGLLVLEAVQPVKRTPVREWIARGLGGHFVVKRLKRAREVLTPRATERLRAAGARFVGKNYDAAFSWSDDRIYCSELVYKVYQDALGIEIGRVQKLRDFDLSDPVVKRKLVERYGQQIPLDETVVSPAAVFDALALDTVLER